MFKSLVNSLKLGLTIIGTTIGAGFASGREIWEFFTSYGVQSIYGIVITIILFALSNIFIVWISYKYKTENYYELLMILMGKKLATVFDGFIFLYLFSGAIIMFAGSGAAFAQWQLSFLLGVFVLAISVWLVLIRGVTGILNINSLLIPFLVITLIYISANFINSHQNLSGDYLRSHLNVWPSAITYSALNVISLLGVLSTMGRKVSFVWEIILGGIFAAVTLGLVAFMLNASLLRVESVQQYEIPLFSLVTGNQGYFLIVTIVLWLAIYTTALSNIHSLVRRIQTKRYYSTGSLSLVIILLIIPLTFAGFSTLVKILYPLYGVLNLYVLAVLILYPFQISK